MKLVEKKCPNCGANIEFNSDDKSVTCNYCNTTFTIEKDPTEEIKEEFILRAKTVRKMSKTVMIFSMVVFIIILIIAIIMFTRITNMFPKFK